MRAAQLAQFFDKRMARCVDRPSPSGATQLGAGGDAHRSAIGVVVGQRVGDLAGTLPARPRRGDIAPRRPASRAHVPRVCVAHLAGSLEMFGDERRVLVGGFRLVGLDNRGQAPVPLGAVGFQLGFVCDCAGKRMMKCIFRSRGEPHLIYQLRPHQFIEGRFDTETG